MWLGQDEARVWEVWGSTNCGGEAVTGYFPQFPLFWPLSTQMAILFPPHEASSLVLPGGVLI